jgi:hypothetical protein
MPEEKKRFTAARGSRVEVGISGDAEETARPARPEEEARAGALYEDPGDEPLQRRLRPGPLVFLDLGTRLRSVPPSTNFADFGRSRSPEPKPDPDDDAGNFNEYLEAEIDGEAANMHALARGGVPPSASDPYGLGANHVQADIPDAVQFAFDAALLGKLREGSADAVSPLDTFKANGSGRKLPACAPIPFVATVETAADYHEADGYPTDAFDFELYDGEETLTFPNTTVRERVEDLRAAADDTPSSSDVDTAAVFAAMVILQNARWKEREPEDSEPSERWNPANVEQGEATRGAEHDTKGQAGRFGLRVRSRLIYEPFDTGDAANFKVTKEPRFDAAEVEFKLSGSRPARVLLRPQLLACGRSQRWTAFREVSFETYKFEDGDGNPAYAHNRHENAETTAPGFFFELSVENYYDPAAAPRSLHVSATITSPGVAMLSTGDEVTNAGTVDLVPGVRINALVDSSAPVGSVYSIDVRPAWTLKFFSAFARAEVVRGMHAGRWPCMPRSGVGNWDSVLTFAGANDFSFLDAASGVTINYSAAEAATKTGRTVFHGAEPSKLAAAYDRHAARDRSLLVFRVQPMNAAALGLLGVGVSETDARAIVGTATAAGVYPAASAEATLDAQADADAEQIAAAVGGLGAHVRDATSGFVANELFDRGRAVCVPPSSVPAGVLCGIVKQSSTFYVWRRVADSRGGYDFDRNQGSFRLS